MDHLARIAHIEIVSDERAAELRKLTGAQKLALLDKLVEKGMNLVRSRVRELHPDWDEGKIAREVALKVADMDDLPESPTSKLLLEMR